MKNALKKLDGSELNGRKLKLIEDRAGGGGGSRYRRCVHSVQLPYYLRLNLHIIFAHFCAVALAPGHDLVIAAGLIPGLVLVAEIRTVPVPVLSRRRTTRGREAVAGLVPVTILSRDALTAGLLLGRVRRDEREMTGSTRAAGPGAVPHRTTVLVPCPQTRREALHLLLSRRCTPPVPPRLTDTRNNLNFCITLLV